MARIVKTVHSTATLHGHPAIFSPNGPSEKTFVIRVSSEIREIPTYRDCHMNSIKLDLKNEQ